MEREKRTGADKVINSFMWMRTQNEEIILKTS